MFATDIQQFWERLQQLDEWFREIAIQYGYLGVFLISLFGASSIVFPIPYTVIIFTIGSLHILDPLLIAISGGLGSAGGEFFGYFLGYFGRTVVSEDRKRKMDYILRVFSRYGSISIFIFALTPLPDDLLFIPLGIMRYSFLKAFVPCLLGKILMCSILAYGGYLSIGFIKNILGDAGGVWTTVASAILLAAVIVIMFKVDWEKVFPLEEKSKANEKKKL